MALKAKVIKTITSLIFILIIGVIPQAVRSEQNSPEGQNLVFIPLVRTPRSNQVILGVYTEGYLGYQETIANEVQSIDAWSGKHLSLVGTYIAFEDPYEDYNIRVPLGMIWDSDYTPFVNMNTKYSLSYINRGDLDQEIREMAKALKNWREDGLIKGQNRRAFVAPLQEMNGDWTPYHGPPSEFKRAFDRIQSIFDNQGATNAVRWVFAPNGWSEPDSLFEYYYPGDDSVEVVALSAYNSGYCPAAEWKSWDGAEKVYGSYLERMVQMAPEKPIIVAQTATTAHTPYGYDENAKSQWIIESFTYLSKSENVFGIIYFNRDKECDWAYYQYENGGRRVEGYRQVVAQPEFIYISPTELSNISVTP